MTSLVYDYADINARLTNGFREPEPKRELVDDGPELKDDARA